MFLAQLCRTNKIYVSATVYTVLSQFSDPEGQRFESSRSHQEQHLMGCCSFCYARILWGSKRGGFEQPVPRALRPAGQKHPGGAFLGRGLANPFGHTKKRISMYFCNALFVLMLFKFRIILVAYHLPHPCTDLLSAVRFSADLNYRNIRSIKQ